MLERSDSVLGSAGLQPERTVRVRTAFAAIAFDVLADGGLPWEPAPSYARLLGDPRSDTVVADVACAVRVDRSLPEPVGPLRNVVLSEATPRGASLRATEMRAELTRVAKGRYAAAVRVAQSSSALSALLSGLASAITELEGGLCLHAAAVELDGEAVLFVGPSGAGKSTAVRLSAGARVFAHDRVSVVVGPGCRLLACALPGGDASAGERVATTVLPVAALLRVRKGVTTQALALDGAQALFAVRESMALTDFSHGAEPERIARAERLTAALPVGVLHTVLGQPVTPALRAFIAAQPARACWP